MPKFSDEAMDLRRRIVGSYLRRVRSGANLTQVDVARALGYTTAQFVSNWERGMSLPPLKSLRTLVEVLGVEWDEMYQVFCRYQTAVAARQEAELRRALKPETRGRPRRASK